MTREEAIEILESIDNDEVDEEFAEAYNKAIKALEQEPCEDAVSRQAIYFKLTNGAYPNETIEQFIDRLVKELDALPPITPQQLRWIPCSERLPEEYITVIGITTFDDIYKAELYDDCGEKKWYADGAFDVPIVAWMPLSKPYKAESECK